MMFANGFLLDKHRFVMTDCNGLVFLHLAYKGCVIKIILLLLKLIVIWHLVHREIPLHDELYMIREYTIIQDL